MVDDDDDDGIWEDGRFMMVMMTMMIAIFPPPAVSLPTTSGATLKNCENLETWKNQNMDMKTTAESVNKQTNKYIGNNID